MHDFVEQILSPLIQIIFVIAILAMMADARPEAVIKLVLDAVVSIIEAAFKATAKMLEIIYNILKILFGKKSTTPRKSPRPPKSGRKPKTKNNVKLVEVEVLPPQSKN